MESGFSAVQTRKTTVRTNKIDSSFSFLHNKSKQSVHKKREVESLNYKKVSTLIFMVSGVAMVVWGFLANDWSKCWLCPVIGGVIGVAVGMLGEKNKK